LAEAVSALALCTNSGTAVPVVAVDVPSGWPVDGNDAVNPSDYMPDMLISLTAPKLCARHFTGRYHFLGGRGFMSARLSNQFSLSLPLHSFQGCDHSFHIIDDIIDFETAHD
jgi:NAD(P)H-hydrate epimerase